MSPFAGRGRMETVLDLASGKIKTGEAETTQPFEPYRSANVGRDFGRDGTIEDGEVKPAVDLGPYVLQNFPNFGKLEFDERCNSSSMLMQLVFSDDGACALAVGAALRLTCLHQAALRKRLRRRRYSRKKPNGQFSLRTSSRPAPSCRLICAKWKKPKLRDVCEDVECMTSASVGKVAILFSHNSCGHCCAVCMTVKMSMWSRVTR